MGEYATRTRDGETVKIGTCEEMYYLRYDQREQVRQQSGNVSPIGDALALRFRFPFPWEDHIAPGDFDGPQRPFTVHGLAPDANVKHDNVQLSGSGYLASIPCPEGAGPHPVPVARNEFPGAVGIWAQKPQADGTLWTVLRCNCGAMWRTDADGAERVAVALRADADRLPCTDEYNEQRARLHAVADRVLAGRTTRSMCQESNA